MLRRFCAVLWMWVMIIAGSMAVGITIGGQLVQAKDRGKVVNVPLVQSERCLARFTKLLPKGERFWGMDAPIVTAAQKDGAGRGLYRGYTLQMELILCVQEQ